MKQPQTLFISALCAASTLAMCANKPADNSDKWKYTPPYFPKSESVRVEKLSDEYIFSVTRNMQIVDSVILINTKCVDNIHWIQAIDINTKKHIASFGSEGRGEGELLEYSVFTVNPKTKEFYAVWNNKYVVYDLKKALNGQTCLKKQGIYSNPTSVDDIYYLNDNKMLHLGTRPRFAIVSKDMQDTLGRYDERHYISKRFAEHSDSDLQRRYFNNCSLFTLKPDKSKFVNAIRGGFYMEIFDIKGNKITPARECRFVEPRAKDEVWPMNDCMIGPFQVRSTDKYIYVLYTTDKGEEIKNFQLAVLDWNGKEVKNYVLDKYVYNFAITLDDKRCYCWTHEADGDYLAYFDLK